MAVVIVVDDDARCQGCMVNEVLPWEDFG